MEKKSNHCMVCDCLTDNCPPSPFMPYSGWRCQECVRAHRIPYEDLLMILDRKGATCYEEALEDFRVWWRGSDGQGPDNGVEYAEKYWFPTLKFFNKTSQEAWEEANTRS